MKTAVFAYSRKGIRTARRVISFVGEAEAALYVPERLKTENAGIIPRPSRDFYGEQFRQAEALIFIGACGIAVRAIAPHVRSKVTDPAVLCIDELGQYVIPLLSGHIGGANELAERLAAGLGAQAVITTATDINRRFSVDTWAVQNGFLITDLSRAKEISAAILEGDIPFSSMLPVPDELPAGLIFRDHGPLGIFVTWEKREPYEKTLRLVPKVLHLGIGCRKGTDTAAISRAVSRTLSKYDLDPAAVKCAASIDLKADETGLLEYCREDRIPVSFFSAEELMAVEGDFHTSDFVREITGADNVCERVAMIGAHQLIVPKTVLDGVTVAVAAEMKEVRFE